ncbi:hypothetical protein HZI73_10360 [Vallitalea pronyensis]|uniref:Cell wall-active antibiotics response LiaF-like C-terminal domain-containing protein n=1 Tax=Vallitalea pronyensis TaxID=1348613 RepID=A0A8J8SGJ8_9FIRM|nr:DUF5668 domain-containing protein [Vallitalea pronyensis]QUI22676.1 hypothetical protein HZI73_10360 [Vallitalea pronyensis]
MKRRSLLGVLIIVVGIIILLGNLDYIDTGDIFGTYWPLVIVAIGLVNLLDRHGSKMFASILIIVGAVLQLEELDIEVLQDVNIYEFIFPAIIILVGLWIIIPRASREKINRMDSKDVIDHISIFSGRDVINNSSDFKGGNLFTVFGGIDVDLTQANILSHEPIVIDVFAAFGGIELKVPIDWRVEYHGISLFGGADNKTVLSAQNNKVLIIKGLVIFGGLDIKN